MSEFSTLESLLRRAEEGHGQIAVVEGEPGIGKTTLLNAVSQQAAERGFTVLAATADEVDSHHPFGLLVDAADIAAAPNKEAAAVAALLRPSRTARPSVFGSGPDQEVQIVLAMIGMFQAMAEDGPVLLCLDDLQWADLSSIQVLARLQRMVPGPPLAVLCAFRPIPRSRTLEAYVQQVVDGGGTVLPLGPLAPDAVEELARARLGELDSNLRRHLMRAAGNSLFVTELVAAAADRVEEEGPLPASLDRAIHRRLGLLSSEARTALETGAVLGSRFSVIDLATVAGRSVSDLLAPLKECLAAGLLDIDGADVVFRHDLVREALYEGLKAPLRAGLHADAARTLAAAGAPVTKVAGHVIRGSMTGDRRAVGWLAEAAREVAERAPGLAAELLEGAVELTGPEQSERHELLADLAVNLFWAGRLPAAESVCRDLLSQPSNSAAWKTASSCLVRVLCADGRVVEAQAEAERLSARTDLSATERSRIRAWVSTGSLADRLEETLRNAHATRGAAEEAGDDFSLAVAYAMSSAVLGRRGQLSSAVAESDRALAIIDASSGYEVHRFPVGLFAAENLLLVDRAEDALGVLVRSIGVSDAIGARWNLPFYHRAAALACFVSGRWDEAVDHFGKALALTHDVGSRTGLIYSLSMRAIIALHRDEVADAAALLDTADQEFLRVGPQFRFEWLSWARALLLDARGQPRDACRVLESAWDHDAEEGILAEAPLLGPDLVRLAVATGDDALAGRVAAVVAELQTSNNGVAGIEGAALRCQGLLKDDPTSLAAAAAAYGRAGRRFEQALAAEDAAAAWARTGDGDRARQHLGDAVEIYTDLKAARLVAVAGGRLRAAGIRRGSTDRRRRPAYGWNALSTSELRVVALVAAGLSNQEISSRLHISKNTVQTHVSHILTKLGLRSRLELAASANNRPESQDPS